MNAEDLYEEIKAFLRYVGLSFSDMSKVTVTIVGTELQLKYGNTRTLINLQDA